MYIIFLFLFKKSQGPGDMGATATVDIDTSVDVDAQAIFEKSQQINKVTHKAWYSLFQLLKTLNGPWPGVGPFTTDFYIQY